MRLRDVTGRSEKASQLAVLAYGATILALITACLTLNTRLWAVRERLAAVRKADQTPVGVVLPPVEGHGLAGRPVSQRDLQAGREKVLLLVLSPSCEFCDRNWPRWQEIIHSLPSSVKTIVLDPWDEISPGYLQKVNFPVADTITRLSARTILRYRLRDVPQTILLDQQNRAISSITGELDGREINEIIAAVRQ
jgi:hypothetical protein